MNVTNKTTRTFDILNISEDEAKDLLAVTIMGEDDDAISKSAQKTLNKLRQALLEAGITMDKKDAS